MDPFRGCLLHGHAVGVASVHSQEVVNGKMLLSVKAEACKIAIVYRKDCRCVVGRLCTTCRGALFQRREVCRDHI